MAKKTTAKTKADHQALIAERNQYWRVVIVPGPDGSECRVGGKLSSRAAAELCRNEMVQDLADGTYKENGYPAHAFDTWARLHAFLKDEGVRNSREVAKKLTLAQPWFGTRADSLADVGEEIPF